MVISRIGRLSSLHTLSTLLQRVFVVLALSILLTTVISYTRVGTFAGLTLTASAATPATLNFQARLLTSSGAIVPDGTYDVEFKLYDSLAAGASAQGTCSLDSSTDDCWWIETRSGGNAVTVKSGYLTANLGSVTAFGANVPWDQQLYLTMNIYNTTTPGWDGEMTPRLQVTATQYAFSAKSATQLKVTNASNSTTLSVATPTSTNTITLPNASGTVAVSASGNIALDSAGNITLSGQVPIASGGTGASTSQAAINALSQLTTTGDLLYYNGTNSTRLARGSDGQCLTSNTTTILWGSCGTGGSGGVDTVGALDGGTANANGATISGTTIYLQSADATYPGLVSATTQTFAGDKTFNGSVTIAATQELRLVGDTTVNRPAAGAGNAGMLYYDTDTDQLLVSNGTKWVSDRSTATKIVAASNSSQAMKDAADYVADGTDDQVEINAALTAAAGGTVYLAEGTYTTHQTDNGDATILIPNNTTLAGAGRGTLIQLGDIDADENLIENSDTITGTGVVIRDLRLDGQKSLNTLGTQHGVYLNNMGDGTGSSARQGAIMNSIWVENFRSNGIYFNISDNNTLIGNAARGNSGNGFFFYDSSSNNTLSGNIAQGNSVYGFRLNQTSNNNTLTGNTSQGNNAGFYLYSSSGNTLTGNTSQVNTNYGFYLYSASNNSIGGNNIRQNNGAGVMLFSSSSNNAISANKIYDNGNSTTNDGILLDASDGNTITGNDITDTAASTTNYAINISNNTSDNTYLADNRFSSTPGTSTINDAGTGTVFSNQPMAENGMSILNRTLNSTTAFTIQGTNKVNVFNIDTTNGELEVGNYNGGTNPVAGKIVFANSTNANTITVQSAAATANRIITLPDEDGTVCLQGSTNCGFALASGSGSYVQFAPASAQTDTTTNSSIFINKTGASGNILQLQKAGVDIMSINNVGEVVFSPSSNSSNAFIIKDGSGTDVLRIDNTDVSSASNQLAFNGVAGFGSVTVNYAGLGQIRMGNNYYKTDGWSGGTTGTSFSIIPEHSQLTTGTLNGINMTQTFDPVSGNANYVGVRINPTINQTGTATGDYTVLQVRPTVTASTGANKLLVDVGTSVSPGMFKIAETGAVSLQNSSDSITAFQVLDQDGGAPVINIDTTNERVGIGTNSPTAYLEVYNPGDGADLLKLTRTPGSNYVVFEKNDFGTNQDDLVMRVVGYSGETDYVFSHQGHLSINSAERMAANLGVAMSSATTTGLLLKGVTSQTADYLQVQASNGEALSGFNANGGLYSYGTNNTFYGLATPAFTTVSTGSSYYYVITATNAAGETVKSTSLGMADNTSTLQWTQVNGATGYKIYRNTSNIFTIGSLLLTTITNGTTVSYADTGSATGAGLPPTAPSGTGLAIRGWQGQTGKYLDIQNTTGNTYLSYTDSGGLGLANGLYSINIGPAGCSGGIRQLGICISSSGYAQLVNGHGFDGGYNFIAGDTGVDRTVMQLQGAGSIPSVIINASGSQSASLIQLKDSAGNVNASFNALGNQLTLGRIAASGTVTQGKLLFSDGTTDNFGLTLQSATLTASRTINLPNEDGTVCLQGSTNCSFASTTGSANYIQNQNAGQQATSNFWISGTGRADTSFTTPLLDTATAVALNIGTTNATSINLNQNTTIAAGKSLTVAGGNTASRPGSPTEGMVYYDTATKQLLTYSNGKWQADSKTAAFIVAASDSTQADKDGAQYVANGEDSSGSGIGTLDGDQIEINAALTAAGAAKGGTVYLAPGTYTIDAAISIPNNVILAGSGESTLIRLGNFGATSTDVNMITNTDTGAGTGIKVRDMSLDGRKSINTSGTQHGIYFSGMGDGTGASARKGAEVMGTTVKNLRTQGIYLSNSDNNNLSRNTTTGVANYGFYIDSSNNNVISANNSQGNGNGIIVTNSSYDNTMTGNTVQGNVGNGIGVYSSKNTITGNAVNGNLYGIYVNSANNNTIVGNKLYDNGDTTTNNSIYIVSGDANAITGNDITDTAASTTNYSINISDSTSDNNYLADNRFSSTPGTSTINDAGTGTVYANQARAENGMSILNRTLNSISAFTVQGTNKVNVFNIDTTNGELEVGNYNGGTNPVAGKIVVANATNANTVTVQSAAQTGNYTATIPVLGANDTFCLLTLNNCANNNAFIQNGNSFGAAATLGTNDGYDLNLETNSTTRMTINATTGDVNFTGNVTLATGKTLRVTGDITGNRPSAATAGQLYYDTTTNEMLVSNGTKWVSDSTTAILVAASNSSQADKDAADYIADATDDQTEINAALTAADPAGAGRKTGKVYLFAGTYVLSDSILVPNNTMLAGSGRSTVIELGTLNVTEYAILNADTATGTGVTIRDLRLDGRSDLNTIGSQYGIVFDDMGGGSGASARQGAKVQSVWIDNFRATAIRIQGASSNNIIEGAHLKSNNGYGLYVAGANSVITNNVIQGTTNDGIRINATNTIVSNNTIDGGTNGASIAASMTNVTLSNNTITNVAYGVVVETSAADITIVSNAITNVDYGIWLNDSTTRIKVTSNSVKYATSDGIVLDSSSGNIVSDNTFYDTDDDGITVQIASHNNIVTGNTIDTVADVGILLIGSGGNDPSGNTVDGNRIVNPGGSTLTRGVMLTSADNNKIAGNIITDASCSSTCYAIDITDAASATNYLADNRFSSTPGTSTINDAGTGTVYANQARAENGMNILNRTLNSTAAFTVQGTNKVNIFNIDTTNGELEVGSYNGGTNPVAGKIVVANTSNANTVTIQSGVTSASYSLTLPTALGPSGSCLYDTTGAGVLGFGTCGYGSIIQVPGSTAQNTITPTAASVVGLTVNGTSNGTGATALIVNQSNATQTGLQVNLTNTSGTQSAGLQVTRNGAGGTTTSLLGLTNTAGTATNGILFTGAVANDITSAAATDLTVVTGTTGALTLDSGTTGAVNIGTNANPKTIQIGNTANAVTTTIGIGNNGTASSVSNVTIGNLLGASSTTFQAGSGGITLNANTWKRSASGTTTIDLINASNTTLAVANSGAGVAHVTVDGNIAVSGAEVRRSLGGVIAGSAGWFKLGAISLPQGGHNATVRINAGAGYNANNGELGILEINIRTSNGSDVNASGFAASVWATRTGINQSFGTQVKLVSNAAGTSATSYDVYVYTDTFVGQGYYTIDTGSSGSWTEAIASASDPGANSSTVFKAPLEFWSMNDTTVFGSNANSTSAFTIQNASNSVLFLVDSTNARLYVGPTSGDTVGTLLVLGKKTNAGDPTGVEGAMYYNSKTKDFRCYQNGGWRNCVSNGYETLDLQDEFMSGMEAGGPLETVNRAGELNWHCLNSSGADACEVNWGNEDANHPGIVFTGSNSTTSGREGRLSLRPIEVSSVDRVTFIVRTTDSTYYQYSYLQIGLFAGMTAFNDSTPDSGAYFRYDGTGSNWYAVTRTGNVETGSAVNTGVSVTADTWYRLEIVRNASDNFEFYINGTLVSTNTTNKPSGSHEPMLRVYNGHADYSELYTDYFSMRSRTLTR